jgi:hypothetical protein
MISSGGGGENVTNAKDGAFAEAKTARPAALAN